MCSGAGRRRRSWLHTGLDRHRAEPADRRHPAAARRQRRQMHTRTHALAIGSPALDASPDDATVRRRSTRSPAHAGPRVTSARSRARRCSAMAGSRRWSAPTGPDELTGTAGVDVIGGLNGDDDIAGLGGNDLICAGGGADSVFGSQATTCSSARAGMTGCSVTLATTRSTAGPVRTNVMVEPRGRGHRRCLRDGQQRALDCRPWAGSCVW